MFRNKSFLVKVVEDPNENKESNNEPIDYDKIFKVFTQAAILVVAAYMGADTLRKIIVHTAATKIN